MANKAKFPTSNFQLQISSRLRWFILGFGIWGLGFILSACSTPPTASANIDPTAFIATRVAEILTQQARDIVTLTAPPTTPEPFATITPFSGSINLPTAGATITPQPAPPPTAMPVTPCADSACITASEHLWLERPIPGDYTNFPERNYAYGSTLQGLREPHHGVEFENPSGTPIIAAGAGTVIVAGNDATTAYGLATNFYGNLVVVQLDQTYGGQPVFNLYAHMKDVTAQVGQRVKTGDWLGTVGQTGVAVGPHLHFEVRVGRNDYFSSRNPELWLKPLYYNAKPYGVLAGRVVDTQGRLVSAYTVVVRPEAVEVDNPRTKYIATYAQETLNGDNALQENFALGDLPVGTYTVSVNTTTIYRQTVTVTSGHVSWVEFVVNLP